MVKTAAPAAYTYRFEPVVACDMCAAPAETFAIVGRRLNRSQGAWPRRRGGISTTVCRCTRCGLLFSNPQPVPPSVHDHYDVPPEEYLSYGGDVSVPDSYLASELAWLERLRPMTPGMRALDVGAGIGKAMMAMQRRGLDAYGFEPSRTFHRHAIEQAGVPADRLALASMESADYAADSFDFINFGAVLEHLYSPAASLARAVRWLKPGGLMYAEVPSARWLIAGLANAFYRLTGTDYVANLSPMHPPFHLYEFTLEAFRHHGRAAGYEIADSRVFVCHTYLPPVARTIAAAYMESTGRGMQLCVWLRKAAAADQR